ncbi:hypothetical protein OJ253_3710 [Cryptosporidium canis]|uniref:Secretin/TonB short N-terminal domain-containing protein n=1 Tax=Cryptosporidium canis TaxID=195482 RepID=A0A9D5DDN6_9CRYT|nr:hypothetical protein OJ253_3710 [Cryptosporidium canis]
MKLTAILLLAAVLQVSANGFGQEKITISVTNTSLEQVLDIIKKQSGYYFIYRPEMVSGKKISLHVRNASLEETLDKCLGPQRLTYNIVGKSIVISLAQNEPSVINKEPGFVDNLPFIDVKGRVINESGEPVPGVTVTVKGTSTSTVTNSNGEFSLSTVDQDATLIFTHISMETFELNVKGRSELTISLKNKISALGNVTVSVNTGYQQVPKERATGSFVQINNELYNRRVSADLLSRLDGIATGVLFQKGTISFNENLGISIRGKSTISSRVSADPLIILDNFPFNGDINDINPNDVESISILKDAAAASIWGARSGNGVIVITTKKGNYNQKMKIEFNANTTVGEKPDLFYSKQFLNSNEYIEIETQLFEKGYFNSDVTNSLTFPSLSPVVEILAKKRAGLITAPDADNQINALRNYDIRNDYLKYSYQNSISQQYYIGTRGGTPNHNYSFSLGYDRNKSSLVRNGSERFTLNALNHFAPIKKLEISTNIIYTLNKIDNNNTVPFGSIYVGGVYGNNVYPYGRFVDDNGAPTFIVKDYRLKYIDSLATKGFMDWHYNPLDEINMGSNATKITGLLLKGAAKYKLTNFLSLQFQFQNERQINDSRNFRDINTYVVRNVINQFTQRNPSTGTLTHNFPKGSVLELGNTKLNALNYRLQVNYNQIFKNKNDINALVGAELRQVKTETYSKVYYGYDDRFGTTSGNQNYQTNYPTLTWGSRTIPGNSPLPRINNNFVSGIDRFISYFGIASYTYDKRFTISGSARWDGANIFGAETNDKVVPLWHGGVSWDINNEKFYHINWLSSLKLRATYGFNGNVYNGAAYLVARYTSPSDYAQVPYASIQLPANPNLRWEKVKNINVGLDYSALNNRVYGNVELWKKYSTDLIEEIPVARVSGFSTYTGNNAQMNTKGIDVDMNIRIIDKKFNWTTHLLFTSQKDEIKSISIQTPAKSLVSSPGTGIVGTSLYGVFSYQWAGLDPHTGDPLGYIGKSSSNNYANIINNATPDSLIYHGSARPQIFGSFRNDFSYQGFTLSLNVVYKFKYYFRRVGMNLNLGNQISSPHSDYLNRWQNPGDEQFTEIPSVVYPANAFRNAFYSGSAILVEKADHIRLQDVQLSYTFKKLSKIFSSLQVYGYANNIGILWRANDKGIDPDVLSLDPAASPNPRTFSIGFRGNF